MEAIYGLALLSASILLLGFAAKFRNAPNASNWAKSNILLQTILFTTIAGLVFGISMLIQYAVNYKTIGFGMTEAGLLVAILAISAICWRGIRKMPSATPLTVVSTADNVPPPANSDGPNLRTGRKSAPRKAA